MNIKSIQLMMANEFNTSLDDIEVNLVSSFHGIEDTFMIQINSLKKAFRISIYNQPQMFMDSFKNEALK